LNRLNEVVKTALIIISPSLLRSSEASLLVWFAAKLKYKERLGARSAARRVQETETGDALGKNAHIMLL
jgi:hypothetical protein